MNLKGVFKMDLKKLSDQALLNQTDQLATQSREVLIALLHHLREIERRRLFSALKFQSLFDYVVKRLKFSESEANRRISAMRVIREVPEVEEKLSSGMLTLSSLVLARTLFGKEKKAGRPMDKDAKAQVLRKLENKSTREAQKFLSTINPEMKMTKEITFDNIEDEGLRAKLIQVKGRFAHSNPGMTLVELLHKLCDQELDKKFKSPAQGQIAPSAQKVAVPLSQAKINREVWRRDQARCTECGSTHALKRDHIQPKASGGGNEYENQRILCRNCNQRAAIEYYGLGKMGSYLKSPIGAYGVNPIPLRPSCPWYADSPVR
jgi:hypothetical protein